MVEIVNPRRNGVLEYSNDDGCKIPTSSIPSRKVSKILSVSPSQASKYLAFNVFKHQRALKDKRFQTQCRRMEQGLFHGNVLAVANVLFPYQDENGNDLSKLLVNAQHSLHAVIETNRSEEMWYQEWDCTSFTQLSTLWSQFDAPGSQRTPQEVASAFLDSIGETGWKQDSLNGVASAVFAASLRDGQGDIHYGSKATIDERINFLMEDSNKQARSFIRGLVYEASEVSTSFLKRAVVMMVMAQTHKISPKVAKTFWEKVKLGGSSVGEPTFELREWLHNHPIGNTSGRSKKYGGRSVTNEETQNRCNYCWNAFVEGQSITLRKPPKEVPALLRPDKK